MASVSKYSNTRTGFTIHGVSRARFIRGLAWEVFRAAFDGVERGPPSGGCGAAETSNSSAKRGRCSAGAGVVRTCPGALPIGGGCAVGNMVFGATLGRCSAGHKSPGICPPPTDRLTKLVSLGPEFHGDSEFWPWFACDHTMSETSGPFATSFLGWKDRPSARNHFSNASKACI